MLKIKEYRFVPAEDGIRMRKEYINLKELEKFGFKKFPNGYFKKVYLGNDDDDRTYYRINEDREIKITRLDGELDDTLYDLIKADLVERLEKGVEE